MNPKIKSFCWFAFLLLFQCSPDSEISLDDSSHFSSSLEYKALAQARVDAFTYQSDSSVPTAASMYHPTDFQNYRKAMLQVRTAAKAKNIHVETPEYHALTEEMLSGTNLKLHNQLLIDSEESIALHKKYMLALRTFILAHPHINPSIARKLVKEETNPIIEKMNRK